MAGGKRESDAPGTAGVWSTWLIFVRRVEARVVVSDDLLHTGVIVPTRATAGGPET